MVNLEKQFGGEQQSRKSTFINNDKSPKEEIALCNIAQSYSENKQERKYNATSVVNNDKTSEAKETIQNTKTLLSIMTKAILKVSHEK